MTQGPTPFEVHPSGAYFHGTKADLAVGDLRGRAAPPTSEPDGRRGTST